MNNHGLASGLREQELNRVAEVINNYGLLIYEILDEVLGKANEKQLVDECFDDVLLTILKYKSISYKKI